MSVLRPGHPLVDLPISEISVVQSRAMCRSQKRAVNAMLHGLKGHQALPDTNYQNDLYSSWTTVVFWDVLVRSATSTGSQSCIRSGMDLLDTIEELSDILVLDSALVGDGSGGLRDVLDVVSL